MYTQPVAELIGYAHMGKQVMLKRLQISPVVDAFLKLPDEARGQSGDCDLASFQLQGDEKMTLCIGWGVCLINGDLEIEWSDRRGDELLIDGLDEVQGTVVDENVSLQMFCIEGVGLVCNGVYLLKVLGLIA
ncbi:hypothetical protein SDC9_70354 [bioreactor metagenome]|uniref:Uncharacterized protein n=1 Tax=bioreactor metagenome TaxID=1076179 RepID=A0A644Y6S6_9ZZZZ